MFVINWSKLIIYAVISIAFEILILIELEIKQPGLYALYYVYLW